MNPYPKKQIVFISHESTLTGAPILLLNLIRLVKRTELYDIKIILLKGGPLEEEFKKLGKVLILKTKSYQRRRSFLFKAPAYIRYRIRLLSLYNFVKNADVIFSNTITNGKVLKRISNAGAMVMTYVHELESILNVYKKKARLTLKYSDIFIAPCMAVKDNLILNHNVPENKIRMLRYFFPLHKEEPVNTPKDLSRKKLSELLNFSDDQFYVLGMGGATYRKGIDLFVEAAKIIKNKCIPIQLVWIGKFDQKSVEEKIKQEISTYQLQSVLTLTGQLPHSLVIFSAFDLFALSSREDPYPLVILEAAFCKIPSVSFAGIGGISEFVSDDCGWIIEEMSPKALAQKIIEIKDQKEEIKMRGKNAFKKCIALHANEESVLSAFNSILKKSQIK